MLLQLIHGKFGRVVMVSQVNPEGHLGNCNPLQCGQKDLIIYYTTLGH